MNTKVIYTAVFGPAAPELAGFTNLPSGWDFLVFSDRDLGSLLPVDAHLIVLPPCSPNPRIAAKYVKVRPDLHLSRYETSLYVDANVRFRGNVDTWLDTLAKLPADVLTFRHNRSASVLREWWRVLLYGKEDWRRWWRVLRLLHTQGVSTAPCIQGGLILRHHQRPAVIAVMAAWWHLIEQYSERDQALFAVACKGTSVRTGLIPGILHDSTCTLLLPHRNVRFDTQGKEVSNAHQRLLAAYRNLRLRRQAQGSANPASHP